MRTRLVVLLLVGVVAGAGAVAVGATNGGGSAPAAARVVPFPFKLGPCPIPQRFRSAFVRASQDSRLPLSMLTAVATVESGFRPGARSDRGARGLLQVMPQTASALRLGDVSKPAQNVLAGARYLRLLLDRFESTDLALAAYNAGPTLVDKLGRAPTQETQTYIANVQQRWAALAGCS